MKCYTYARLRDNVKAVNEIMQENGVNHNFTVYAAYGVNSVREVMFPGTGQAYYGSSHMGSPREAATNFAIQLLADGYYEASELMFTSLAV